MSFVTAYAYSEAVADARTPEMLLDLLQAFAGQHGVTGIFVADLPSRREALAPFIRLRGWNTAWIEHYNKQNYVHIDPIAQLLRKRERPYVWSEECLNRSLTPNEKKVLGEAKDAGLIDGFTVPIHGPMMRTTCVSFSTDGRLLERNERQILQLLAIFTHQRLDELTRSGPAPAEMEEFARGLAPQELECLHWAMYGMKSKEIAFRTKLSIRTVDQYIGASILKLRAGNRGEAIRVAIAQGLLKPA